MIDILKYMQYIEKIIHLLLAQETLWSFFFFIAASQSYGLNSAKKTKKKLLAPDISLNLDQSEGSVLSDELDESTELDLDDIDTPSDNSNEFEWEGMTVL